MAERDVAEAHYRAFLSYSHKDGPAAARLHRRLEAYRIPKRLAGRETARGPVPRRLVPIFRDREELPAATDLSETVREALAQSGALIILCSPDAAASLWVAEEIRVFRELHPSRPILAAILDGDPPDCFPPILREMGEGHEPLATDLRRQGDGERLGLLKLVAGIAGLGLDDLVQRDATRRVRQGGLFATAALVMTLVMAGLTWMAIDARREAERQRAEAEGHIEFMITRLRDQLRRVGSIETMNVVDRQALDYYARQRVEDLSPDSLERRARVLLSIAEDESGRGHPDRAGEAAREAYRTTVQLLAGAPDDPERLYAHAQSEYWVAAVSGSRGDHQAALAGYRRYRELAGRMNRLVPNSARYVGELAYAESNLGDMLLNTFRRPVQARPHFEESRRWFQRAAQLEPSNANWRVEAADANGYIALTWAGQGRADEVLRARLAEHAINTGLLREDPDNRRYRYAAVISLRSLARLDLEGRSYPAAETRLRACRAAMAQLLAVDPENFRWRDQAAWTELDLERLFRETGRTGEAREALANARRILIESLRRSSTSSRFRNELRARVEALSGPLPATAPTPPTP